MPISGARDATTFCAGALADGEAGRVPACPDALRRRIRGPFFRAAISPDDAPRRLLNATMRLLGYCLPRSRSEERRVGKECRARRLQHVEAEHHDHSFSTAD